MYLTPNSLSPYTSSRAIAGIRHSECLRLRPRKAAGASGRMTAMTPRSPALMYNISRLKRDICREHRTAARGARTGRSRRVLYPVSRSAFSGELGWRCGTPESRWSLCRDTRSYAVHERHDCLPSLPVVEPQGFFTMSCSHSPSCRAASFVPPRSTKRYSNAPRPHPLLPEYGWLVPLLSRAFLSSRFVVTGRRYLISRLLSTALVDSCRFRFSPLMPADVSLIPG